METFLFNGKKHKVFKVNLFGSEYKVFVMKDQYRLGGMALTVWEINADGEPEPFGTLTVYMDQFIKDTCAFVKNYSENETWAEDLAVAIGGKPTGITCQSGYVSVPLYDFSTLDITED